METLIGLLLLVAVIWVVRVALTGADGTTGGSRRHTPDGAGPVPPPSTTDEAERRRQARADEAFVDGVLFAHHFDPFDRFGDDDHDVDPEAEAYWGDDGHYEDGWDDDVFHDDAGDW